MAILQYRPLLTAMLVTALAGMAEPAWALPITQSPLTQSQQVAPAFIMALDNSGSMGQDETLCISTQGECSYKTRASATAAHPVGFFDGDGSMYEDVISTSAPPTGNVDYFRTMRGGTGTEGGNYARAGTDIVVNVSGGSCNNSTSADECKEAPRVDLYAAIRDPEFDGAYYNPADSYTPWLNFDATPYFGACPAAGCGTTNSAGANIGSAIANYVTQTGASAGNAVITAAPEDPRHPGDPTDANTTNPTTIDVTHPVLVSYTYVAGDVIPAGNSIVYESSTTATNGINKVLDCNALKNLLTTAPYPTTPPANGTLIVLRNDYPVPVTGSGATGCNHQITTQYYPATVYLTTNTATAPDAITGFDLTKVITVAGAGPLGVPLYKYEIIPGNFAAPSAAVNYATAIQNFANYWTYFGDRARSVVGAGTESFAGVDFMRVGAFNINDPTISNFTGYGASKDPLVAMYDMSDYRYNISIPTNPSIPTGGNSVAGGGDRYKFYAQILAFDQPNGSTPTRTAVYRIGHQFRRSTTSTNPYYSGETVANASTPVILACQVNAGMLFTDGYINFSDSIPNLLDNDGTTNNNEDGTTDSTGSTGDNGVSGYGNAPFADSQTKTMSDIAAWSYKNNLRTDLTAGRVTPPPGCASATPSPQLDCDINPHMNFYGVPLGARGIYYGQTVAGVTYVDNPTTPNDDEATDAAFAHPPVWGATGTTNLQPSDVDDIWHAAINTRGKFISAQSPARVRQGITSIINNILDASLGSGTQTNAGVRLSAGSITYSPSFTVAGGTDWTGDLAANFLNSDGSPGASAWGTSGTTPITAGSILNGLSDTARATRPVLFMLTPGNSAARAAVQFGSSNFTALGATEAARFGAMGTTVAAFHASFGVNATSAMLMDYLKGVAANEVRNGGTFRSRSGVMGDIVDSEPEVSSNTDDFGYSTSLPLALGGGATYTNFVNNIKSTRTPSSVVYIGANDGMLHAFDASAVTSDANGGSELFGFIPNSVTSKLYHLADPAYPHYFYVDGGTNIHDAYLGGAWKTVLVGSTGAGGSGVYALDVSNPSTVYSNYLNSVMWELTSASDPDLGSDVGRPTVILGEDNNWYAAFGNGYNSTNHHAGIFLVNLSTGAITKKLIGDPAGTGDNGIGFIAPVDSDGDGKTDTIYGGDYLGNVWKFDISSATTSVWNVAFSDTPLYVAKDSLGTAQPITGDIEVGVGPLGGLMVYFGTGSYFLTGDNQPPAAPAPVQSLYGVWDNGSADTTGRSSLVAQTITSSGTAVGGVTPRLLSNNSITYSASASTSRGFVLDLEVGTAADGEKFFGRPQLVDNTIFFDTFELSKDACTPGGTTWEYGLDAFTGNSALNGLHLGSLSGTSICSGSCGAISVSSGAPVRTPSQVVPGPSCITGMSPGCPIPAKTCNAAGVCTEPPPATPLPSCSFVDRSGSSLVVRSRACGRQSWRQVR